MCYPTDASKTHLKHAVGGRSSAYDERRHGLERGLDGTVDSHPHKRRPRAEENRTEYHQADHAQPEDLHTRRVELIIRHLDKGDKKPRGDSMFGAAGRTGCEARTRGCSKSLFVDTLRWRWVVMVVVGVNLIIFTKNSFFKLLVSISPFLFSFQKQCSRWRLPVVTGPIGWNSIATRTHCKAHQASRVHRLFYSRPRCVSSLESASGGKASLDTRRHAAYYPRVAGNANDR